MEVPSLAGFETGSAASSNATAAVIGDGDANMHLRQTLAHVVVQAPEPLGILASLTIVFLISTELRLRRFEAISEQAAASRCVCRTLSPLSPSDLTSLANNLTSPQIAFRTTLHMPSQMAVALHRKTMSTTSRPLKSGASSIGM